MSSKRTKKPAAAKRTTAKGKTAKAKAVKAKPTKRREQPRAAKRKSSARSKGKPAARKPRAVAAVAANAAVANTFALPEACDSGNAAALHGALLARRGRDIEIDAANVYRVGALSLQVLLSSSRLWAGDGRTWRIVNPSEPLLGAIDLVGIGREELNIEVAGS